MKWKCKGLKIFNNCLIVPFAGGVIDTQATYIVKIEKYRKKRSLSANAYAWVLIDNIAKVVKTSKYDVYLKAIKACGVFEDFILKTTAVKKFCEIWESKGIGWHVEIIREVDKHTEIRVHYGSSSYNSKEMARLIDWLVDECKQLEIPTKNDFEIQQLLKYWEAQCQATT